MDSYSEWWMAAGKEEIPNLIDAIEMMRIDSINRRKKEMESENLYYVVTKSLLRCGGYDSYELAVRAAENAAKSSSRNVEYVVLEAKVGKVLHSPIATIEY